MKKIIYLLLFFCLIALTCKKKNEEEKKPPMVCASKPLELLWIKDMIAGKGECVIYKYATLTMFASENETLFYLANSASSVGICGYVVYNCDGKRVSPEFFNPDLRSQFLATHTNGIVIWEKN